LVAGSGEAGVDNEDNDDSEDSEVLIAKVIPVDGGGGPIVLAKLGRLR
jgi:hypothetical protein